MLLWERKAVERNDFYYRIYEIARSLMKITDFMGFLVFFIRLDLLKIFDMKDTPKLLWFLRIFKSLVFYLIRELLKALRKAPQILKKYLRNNQKANILFIQQIHHFIFHKEVTKSIIYQIQWSSNFFSRGTLKRPKNFWRHTQICHNGKIDTETENLYNMKFFEEFSVRFD